MSQALKYAWNQDIDIAIVGMNKIAEVEQNVATTKALQPLTEDEEKTLQEIGDEITKANRLASSGVVFLG